MVKIKHAKMQRLLHNFADGTSMHGIPRIINARSLPVRLFWTCVCVGAFGMFLWQTTDLLRRYWKYPKKVNMEIIQKPVPFPSVSVCNTDHLDLQVVDRIDRLFFRYDANYTATRGQNDWLDEFMDSYDAFYGFAVPLIGLYTNMDASDVKERFNDMLEVNSRIGMVANMGPDMASKAGVKLTDFIVSCQFLNEDCELNASFSTYFDPHYFNCFTFNPEAILPTRNTRLQGVEYGLSLILFSGSAGQIPQPEFILPGMQEANNALASGRGARVVVHSPGTRPHPTAEGFDIAPGFSVNIGVKARENERIGPPHGNCSQHLPGDDKFNYTLIECQNACIQRHIIETCGCVDNQVPPLEGIQKQPFCFKLPEMSERCIHLAYASTGAPINDSSCFDSLKEWRKRYHCRKKLYDNLTILNPGAMDDCNCYPPCHDIIYDSAYSLSTLPAYEGGNSRFHIKVDEFMTSTFPAEKTDILRRKYPNSSFEAQVRKQVSRLNVHIADSNIIKTTEAPDYEAIRLVSDIGGQLGLWIGISVITLFEVLQVRTSYRIFCMQLRTAAPACFINQLILCACK